MDEREAEILKLKQEVKTKEEEIGRLKLRLQELESQKAEKTIDKLSNEEIARFSRQLILPEIRTKGQLKLKTASVLVVGAGGLGCPAALYLATAGIGKIGIIDYDEVEINNLHRQVLHEEHDIGKSKAESVASSIFRLNANCISIPYSIQLSSHNALSIVKEYDVIVDATDNLATRYLLNDACVLANKPLVSGSALRFEGQLTVYHYENGPCYRCIFPEPPPPETVTNCTVGGVIGMVTGVIGCLQALEVIKIVIGLTVSYNQKLLLFDGQDGNFKVIKLRPKNPNCTVCGTNPTITTLIDYEQFCGSPANDKDICLKLLSEEERITCVQYNELLLKKTEHLLVDVRPAVELDICSLPNTFNIPINDVEKTTTKTSLVNALKNNLHSSKEKFPVIVVCRRGHDSQLAVRKLQTMLAEFPLEIKDLKGGLYAWAQEIDEAFPIY